MAAPDSRTRNTISLDSSRALPSFAPRASLHWLLLSNAVLALAVHAGADLLSYEIDVFWVLVRVLACEGLGIVVWEIMTRRLFNSTSIEWSTVAVTSLLLLLQHSCFLVALSRLSPVRAVILTASSSVWLRSLLEPVWTMETYLSLGGLLSSFLLDAKLLHQSFRAPFVTHVAVLLNAGASMLLDDIYKTVPSPSTTRAASVLGASVIALPVYLLRSMAFKNVPTPVVPLTVLCACPLLAFALTMPSSNLTAKPAHLLPQRTNLTYYFSILSSIIFGMLLFSRYPSWSDILVGLLFSYGMYRRPSRDEVQGSRPIMPILRSYLKSILANSESRKIFYFLMLNLAYMFVQVLYGVWTNSLGLISDAIHMAFDCMAIGVGLLASVMATLPPNERFTYGYGRIETLSGFANGIFLLLISVFIVFEAIERLMEPPEMNTNQLLLISSMGLGVNLFGMFAMGGHHHHGGHSHSHGHSHGPSPSHSLAPVHSHSADHDHSSVHSHSIEITPATPHVHSPCGDHDDHSAHSSPVSSNHDDHSHSPISFDQPHSHSHSHSHSHLHSHASHSHSPPLSRTSSAQGHQRSKTEVDGQIDPVSLESPLTPNYHFGHDAHYESHHHLEHVPNLHDHSHGHDHGHEGHSHNMRGVFLHVMADTLGSVGVIISTLLIQWYGWTGFDPIASLFIAVMIAASVVPLVIDTGKILCLDLSDQEATIHRALLELDSLEGVASYKLPRFWPKDSSSVIGSICIQINTVWLHSESSDASEIDRVVERVDSLLRSRISGLEELTIQVEGR
ncbi:cation efflux protein [Neolentinus lepideus HHB14362 ss-1]|uniref:Cation efflux protein n=1 Tax=Neolentinus lepideus HHB14362 ss-1 TaxID=1314782 RepID=A0A165U8J6_9AGAM|nr:cation efflux protein [Neolentinus lepideus HHB14362 ss-1]